MKKYPFYLKVLVATLGCFLIGYACLLASGLQAGFPKSLLVKFSGEENYQTIEFRRNIPAGSMKKIIIESVSADISIKASEGDQIEIYYRGQGDEKAPEKSIDIIEKNGELYITTLAKNFDNSAKFVLNFSSSPRESGFVISVPKTIKNLELITVSGDILLKSETLERLLLQTVSGDTAIASSLVKSFAYKTTSGDLEFKGAIENLEGKSVSGDLDLLLENDRPKIAIESTSGDTTIKMKPKPNLGLQFNSISGDLDIDNQEVETTALNSSYSTKFGEGAGKISISTTSGSLKFRSHVAD